MPISELNNYISVLREKNIPDDTIKAELLKHDWPEKEINEALSPDNSNISLPPPPVPRLGMWITFQYFILFICLYVSATALGGIMHIAVDQYVADTIKNASNYRLNLENPFLKFYLAGIIVTFPIFALLFVLLKKEALKNPAIKNIQARKQLFYITLTVTFIIMIGHLIATIYGFLNGSATLNSLAQLAVTFLVAGSIFAYLLHEVKEDRKANV